jgi:hypothetical protein
MPINGTQGFYDIITMPAYQMAHSAASCNRVGFHPWKVVLTFASVLDVHALINNGIAWTTVNVLYRAQIVPANDTLAFVHNLLLRPDG